MKRFFVWTFLMSIPSTCWATVDVGRTARLIGVTGNGRWAIVSEETVGESCEYDSCLVYGIDVTRNDFVRRFSATLPSRNEELRKELCAGRVDAACLKKVAGRLHEDIQATEAGNDQVLRRYIKQLRFWQRAILGRIESPPPRISWSDEKAEEVASSLTLSELGSAGLTLKLEERWNVASFRSFNEHDQGCNPERRKSCQRQERWEDGVRSQRWVCDAATDSSKRAEDCAGRASMVRVVAQRGEEQSVGRSNLIEPGAIARFAVGQVKARRIDMKDLTFVRDQTNVYQVGASFFAVGAFCEGFRMNGTWFPFAVAVPP